MYRRAHHAISLFYTYSNGFRVRGYFDMGIFVVVKLLLPPSDIGQYVSPWLGDRGSKVIKGGN